MQHTNYQDKYIAILITEVKSSSRELYPLTKNYPMSLLSIGSKKLIVYQLQALSKIPKIEIVIIIDPQSSQIQNYLQNTFLPIKQFPIPITFEKSNQTNNTFLTLQKTIETLPKSKGILTIQCDTIISININEMIEIHQKNNSDLTLMMKVKKEYSQNEKKNQTEIETEIDNLLIGDKGEVLFLDMADEIENNGVKIDPSVYKRCKKAVFRKVVDSKIYIFSPNLISLIQQIAAEQIYDIKPWLIQFLVANQTNKQLLSLSGKQDLQPLKIYCQLCDQDSYMRKINSKKIYESINFDSIIRGIKQKQILLPTPLSDPVVGGRQGNAIICDSSSIGQGTKVRRIVVGPNCKIGKNVDLKNCIILENTQIKDGCIIQESIVGSGNSFGEGVVFKNSYSESGCRIPDGKKIESETVIANQ